MSAGFWFDQTEYWRFVAGGNPALVDQGFQGDLGTVTKSLWQFYQDDRPDFWVPENYAIYFKGTREEILQALESDYRRGIRQINVSLGRPTVWYLRRTKGSELLVCIAGRGLGGQYYWNIPDGVKPDFMGFPINAWRELYTTEHTPIDLKALTDIILPKMDGAGWYSGPPPAPAAPSAIDFSKSTFADLSNLKGLFNAGFKGRDFYLIADHPDFFIFRRDTIWGPSPVDPLQWRFSGDKVHLSVNPTQVGETWSKLAPILFSSPAIDEFKFTDMARLEKFKGDSTADRIYFGNQITIYFTGSPTDRESIGKFAELMKLVTLALRSHGIRPGTQDAKSDLIINEFLAYRHDVDDLLHDGEAESIRARCIREGCTEEDYKNLSIYINTRDTERYPKHKDLMELRMFYVIVKNAIKRIDGHYDD